MRGAGDADGVHAEQDSHAAAGTMTRIFRPNAAMRARRAGRRRFHPAMRVKQLLAVSLSVALALPPSGRARPRRRSNRRPAARGRFHRAVRHCGRRVRHVRRRGEPVFGRRRRVGAGREPARAASRAGAARPGRRLRRFADAAGRAPARRTRDARSAARSRLSRRLARARLPERDGGAARGRGGRAPSAATRRTSTCSRCAIRRSTHSRCRAASSGSTAASSSRHRRSRNSHRWSATRWGTCCSGTSRG